MGVYEILEYHTDETFPNMAAALGHFRDGLEMYRAGRWDAAIAEFQEVLRLNPEDQVCELYIERCAHLRDEPPARWDGVWVMEEK